MSSSSPSWSSVGRHRFDMVLCKRRLISSEAIVPLGYAQAGFLRRCRQQKPASGYGVVACSP